jgi:hypothetical protein
LDFDDLQGQLDELEQVLADAVSAIDASETSAPQEAAVEPSPAQSQPEPEPEPEVDRVPLESVHEWQAAQYQPPPDQGAVELDDSPEADIRELLTGHSYDDTPSGGGERGDR